MSEYMFRSLNSWKVVSRETAKLFWVFDIFAGRRNDVEVALLARSVEDCSSRPPSNHLHPRSASSQNPTPKSPNRPDLAAPASASPSRRDLSPHIDDKNRLIRSPAAPPAQAHANYQFSNRQSLSADFQTARQMHVEQGASGQGGQPHPQENGQSGPCRKIESHQFPTENCDVVL